MTRSTRSAATTLIFQFLLWIADECGRWAGKEEYWDGKKEALDGSETGCLGTEKWLRSRQIRWWGYLLSPSPRRVLWLECHRRGRGEEWDRRLFRIGELKIERAFALHLKVQREFKRRAGLDWDDSQVNEGARCILWVSRKPRGAKL